MSAHHFYQLVALAARLWLPVLAKVRAEHLRHILATLARDSAHAHVWQYSVAHGS